MAEAYGGSRKSHKKSRNGCPQCKKRRIKCDERLPRCGHCERRNQYCEYELLGYPPKRVPPPKASAAKPTRQKSFQTLRDSPDVTINLRQMELFHHYLTSTSSSLNDKGQEDQIWRVVVPQQAMAHEYLMHAIFAMSAVHIVHLRGSEDPTRSYMTLAQIHHDKSVQLFSSNVTEINSSNCTAALLFSSMHLMFSCCVMHVSGTKQPGEHIDSLVTILTASRGYWALFSSVQIFTDNMPQGERSFLNPCGLVVEDSVIQSLAVLANSNAMSMQSRRTTSICQDTISHLQACLVSGLALPRIFWSLSVNDNYMELLRQRQQMALIILAYGCSLANYAPRRWFLQNWAADVIKSIMALVDPIFSPEMKWPLGQFDISSGGLSDAMVSV